MIVLYVLLTLGISLLNAWSVGKCWNEAKAAGGFAMFMEWCGGIMAACGFTIVYAIIAATVAAGTGHIAPERIEQFMSLTYLGLLPPIFGSGIAIGVQSWAHFYRERTFANGAAAAWNTYANISNIVSAFDAAPKAWSSASKLFDSEDDEGAGVVLMLVALAFGAGIVTAVIIIRAVAQNAARDIALRAYAAKEAG